MIDLYSIHEVDGIAFADEILRFNKMVLEWPRLETRHFTDGFWWLAYLKEEAIAFAGLAPLEPFSGYGYLKRCYVSPNHHGHGLQFRMMMARELKARQLGWTHLVSECAQNNTHSIANFQKAGFERCDPEQKWGASNSVYFIKSL